MCFPFLLLFFGDLILSSTPQEEIGGCAVCNAAPLPPLVSVSCSSRDAFGPTSYGDVECFTCDHCVAHCANSAEHIGSRIVLVLDTLPELGVLSTPPISLLPCPTPTQQQQQQQQMKKVQQTPTMMGGGTGAAAGIPEAAAAAMAMAAGMNKLPDAKVVVRVWSTKLERHMLEMLMEDYKRNHLQKLAGVIDFSYKIAPGLAITFTSYTSIDTAKEGLSLEQRYMQNDALRNVLNSDLECNGLVGCICACACW